MSPLDNHFKLLITYIIVSFLEIGKTGALSGKC